MVTHVSPVDALMLCYEVTAKARSSEARLHTINGAIWGDVMTTFEMRDGIVHVIGASETYESSLGHVFSSAPALPSAAVSLTPLTRIFRAADLGMLVSRLFTETTNEAWEQVILSADKRELMFEHKVAQVPSNGVDTFSMAILHSRDISDRIARQRLELANVDLLAEARMDAATRRHALALDRIANVVIDVRMTEWSLEAARDCWVEGANEAAFEATFGTPVGKKKGFLPMLCIDDDRFVQALAQHASVAREELRFRRPDSGQARVALLGRHESAAGLTRAPTFTGANPAGVLAARSGRDGRARRAGCVPRSD